MLPLQINNSVYYSVRYQEDLLELHIKKNGNTLISKHPSLLKKGKLDVQMQHMN